MRNCTKCNQIFEDTVRYCPADGRLLEDSDPWLGRVLSGRYRIVRRLGEGAMGSAYRAWQVGVERPVAVKILNPQLADNPELVERFRREARALARLSHPGIVTVFAVGETEDGLPYLVMEFVDGLPLSRLIEQGIARNRALAIARQIAAALAEAHAAGIVHRDLKPANIMVAAGRDGDRVKVLDFGIAKLMDRASKATGLAAEQLTRAGDIYGTPQYLSPEQAVGAAVDERSDLYSFGVVLYELLSGKLPFAGDGMAVLVAHLHEPAPRLSGPEGELVFQLMAKNPEDRPVSALSALVALQELENQPSPARTGQMELAMARTLLQVRPPRPRGRSSLRWFGAAILSLAALSGISAGAQSAHSVEEITSDQRPRARSFAPSKASSRAPLPPEQNIPMVPRRAHVLIEGGYSLRVLVPEELRAGREELLVIEAWNPEDRPVDGSPIGVVLATEAGQSIGVTAEVFAGVAGRFVVRHVFESSGDYSLEVLVPDGGPVMRVHMEVDEPLDAPRS